MATNKYLDPSFIFADFAGSPPASRQWYYCYFFKIDWQTGASTLLTDRGFMNGPDGLPARINPNTADRQLTGTMFIISSKNSVPLENLLCVGFRYIDNKWEKFEAYGKDYKSRVS